MSIIRLPSLKRTIENYSSELGQGNISGKSGIFITGNNTSVGNTFVDVNDFGGTEGFASAAESIEILSNDANDTLLGSGVRTIAVTTLDSDYVEQVQIVDMDGTTPVALTGTHLRYRSIAAVTAGTRANTGTITLRVSGGGTTRLQMNPDQGSSYSSLFTVPANKTFIASGIDIFVPKNEDITMRSRFRFDGANASWASGGSVPLYQNSTLINVRSPSELPAKTDLLFQAKSTNVGVTVTIIIEGELINT